MNGHARGLVAAANSRLTLPTANLIAAYDARSFVSVDGGVTASTWTDLSGNGFHGTTATAGARAAISSTGGYPSLLFDGSSDYYNIPGLTLPAGGTRSVYSAQAPVTFSGSCMLFFAAGAPTFYVGSFIGEYGLFDGAVRDSDIALTTARCCVTYEAAAGLPGSSRVWRNGVAGTATGYSSLPAVSSGTIGGYSGGERINSHVHFLAIYTAARNTSVEAFLLQEYGV